MITAYEVSKNPGAVQWKAVVGAVANEGGGPQRGLRAAPS